MADSPLQRGEKSRIAVVIPAFNEERAIDKVIRAIPPWVRQIVVADNGSKDRTVEIARSCGAQVVIEPRKGYGSACLAGIAALDRPDIVVFLDGDFSDHAEEMGCLVEPILRGDADLVIGSRRLGKAESGSVTPQQRFGNALACGLIRLFCRVRYTDLGPFRAIRYSALQRLRMNDLDYGWTAQMQIRAARLGLRALEAPVSYRRRIGKSKISGTIRGVVGAGTKIISTVFRECLSTRFRDDAHSKERLILFARYPESGHAKTRLIPFLGATGAAKLHRQLVRMTLATARRVASVEVRSTGCATIAMSSLFGSGVSYQDQGVGDLGERLRRAVVEALANGAERVVLIGADCPLLTADRLEDAFQALRENEVVIGPAADGGYYLIGMTSDHAELFNDIPWGKQDVLERTVDVCRQLGLRHSLLPVLSDVDTSDDLAAWAAARLAPTGTAQRVSVIIPARNEQDHIAATLGSVLAVDGVEIIVVDGQSEDRTAEIARKFGATVLSSDPSRGVQLNLGAARAQGEILLFLHADTLLPPDYATVIQQTLRQPGVSAGAFDLGIDGRGLGVRAVEWGVRIRSRAFGRPYGDQALFMTVQTFRDCGGFPGLPFMEDFAMLPRLRKRGRIVVSQSRVLTSARRWQERGVIRITLFHQWLILLYYLGLNEKRTSQ
ncbi:MAG: TIGR04283 family arsenosugar biosynthesis glycosyltransferase [Planctomycetota bacterium]